MEPIPPEPAAKEEPGKPVARNPLVALVLSLPAPGLGHLYNGRAPLAFGTAAFFTVMPAIVVLLWAQLRFAVHLIQGTLFFFGPLGFLATGIWAAVVARRQEPRVLQKWQRPLGYATFALVVLMTGLLLGNYVQSRFAIQLEMPHDGLAPDLYRGDAVWVLKTKESRLPLKGALAFYGPAEEMKPPMFVKIEALHPDKVAIKEGAVFINGERKFDAPRAKEMAEAELGIGQAFGIASGRNPDKHILDSRDVGPLRHGDYRGTVAVIGWRMPEGIRNGKAQRSLCGGPRPSYLNKWLVPQ